MVHHRGRESEASFVSTLDSFVEQAAAPRTRRFNLDALEQAFASCCEGAAHSNWLLRWEGQCALFESAGGLE